MLQVFVHSSLQTLQDFPPPDLLLRQISLAQYQADEIGEISLDSERHRADGLIGLVALDLLFELFREVF